VLVTVVDDATNPDDLPLGEVLREDFVNYGRDILSPGLHTVAVHRLGRHAERWPGLSGKVARRLARWAFAFVRNVYGMELPFSVSVGRRLTLAHQSGLVINEASTIGNDVFIRHGVTLGQARVGEDTLAPVLCDGVQIGPNAVIMGGIVIGEGARIGPLAHVIHDVPPYSSVLAPVATVRPRRDVDRPLDRSA
jgi:serine O-acetyltransferase